MKYGALFPAPFSSKSLVLSYPLIRHPPSPLFENDNVSEAYYGWIEEIWELDYFSFKVSVFKCKWIDGEAVKKDRDGFTVVDQNKTRMFDHDPFDVNATSTTLKRLVSRVVAFWIEVA